MTRRSLSRRQLRVLRVFVDNPDREYTGLQVDAELGVPNGSSGGSLYRLERLDFLVSRWEESAEAGDLPRLRLYRLNPDNAASAHAALARAERRRRTNLVRRALRARPATALWPSAARSLWCARQRSSVAFGRRWNPGL